MTTRCGAQEGSGGGAAGVAGRASGFGGMLVRLIAALRRRRGRPVGIPAAGSLDRLDDRMLRDVGLRRSENRLLPWDS